MMAVIESVRATCTPGAAGDVNRLERIFERPRSFWLSAEAAVPFSPEWKPSHIGEPERSPKRKRRGIRAFPRHMFRLRAESPIFLGIQALGGSQFC